VPTQKTAAGGDIGPHIRGTTVAPIAHDDPAIGRLSNPRIGKEARRDHCNFVQG
jgi:hypothetical protein